MKDEPEEAELILHDALRLAYQTDNKKAITYTYDLMANLAFIRGQLENAEQLFKATMSYLLGGGMKQEDNAIIEISLKLASIYAAQNRQEFAIAGYEFCISTLEEKIEREKELAEDIMSDHGWLQITETPENCGLGGITVHQFFCFHHSTEATFIKVTKSNGYLSILNLLISSFNLGGHCLLLKILSLGFWDASVVSPVRWTDFPTS